MKLIKISVFILSTICILHSSTAHANKATWYVSFDMNQILSSEIINIMPVDEDASLFIHKFPQEIKHITLYGDSRGSEDATAVFRGDFSHFSADQYLLDLIQEEEKIAEKIVTSKKQYHNNEITVFSVEEDDMQKHAYFSKINNDLAVMSFHQSEVEKWIDNTNTNINAENGSLFSVQVDVQSALTHMGVNINEQDKKMLRSKILQKVIQASASIREDSSEVMLDVALTSSDEATVIQIEQIVNGLIAMKNLSNTDDDKVLNAVMENLSLQREGNSLRLTTFASIDMIKEFKDFSEFDSNNEINVNINIGD